jgi:hypothetical protein
VGHAFTFRSVETTRHATFRLEEGRSVISVNGASQFRLMFKRPGGEVVVNGVTFKVKRGCRMAMFMSSGKGWNMFPLA